MPAPTPPVITKAFGADASDPDFINLIPETTVDPGRASLSLGFPPQTMTPEIAGGTPPFGQDVNGILFMLSSHTVFQESGQGYPYNSTVATAIGGYAVGTILSMSDGSGVWINRTAANMTDPDAGGAGWVPAYSYGSATVAGLVGGVVVLTPAQAKKKLIILQGVLGSNLQIVLPTRIDDWLIVNQTTGAFSTVVKTLAGSGVTVPQGGNSAPTGVYCDGASIYPQVAPVNLPIDQNPTGLTIVQRTSAGYVTATYFNSNNGIENGNPISAVFYETGSDGYHRKMSPATFAANLALSWIGGQVTNGQVPFSAVQQYAAALFTSPAFTGVPTAPTAAAGTANTQIATTAFVNPGQSLGTNGYVKLPCGLILQWGNSAGIAANATTFVAFPIVFPSACFTAVSCGANAGGNDQPADAVTAVFTSGFNQKNGSTSVTRAYRWFAIGI
jgi:hypothetical protein